MKSVLFCGSSNTFGVGLQTFLYNDYESLKKFCKRPYPAWNQEQLKFIEENRWSNLVCQYLNLKQINVSEAGGSVGKALDVILNYEKNNTIDDIDYIFIEFYGVYRLNDKWFTNENTPIPRTPTEIENFLKNPKSDKNLKAKIENWLINFNPVEYTNETINKLEDVINTHNNKKFVILIWSDDFSYEKYPEHEWLKKYTPKFPTKTNQNNYHIEKFLLENNWTVEQEHKCWNKEIGSDLHPGVIGSKKISNIIIEFIKEKYENTGNNNK